MKDNLFFDLDGTLIDSSERMYVLFKELAPLSNLTFDEYWSLKRNKNNHKEILTTFLKYTDSEYRNFQSEWMKRIETESLLSLDKPFDGITDLLNELSNRYLLHIVTNRQFLNLTKNQIIKLRLNCFFKNIFVTEQKIEKKELICENFRLSANDFIIGDTGKEITTGKELGIRTIAITTGFVNKEKLLEYKPDFLVENIMELRAILCLAFNNK